MKVGILADTHDNLPLIKQAVDFFNDAEVSTVFHAGDFVAPFTLSILGKLRCEYFGVFGNNDGEKNGLIKKSAGRIKEGPCELAIAERRILLLHDLDSSRHVLENNVFDLVIYGHTHTCAQEKQGNTLFFNPGEAGGWITQNPTIGIVDVTRLKGEIIPLPHRRVSV